MGNPLPICPANRNSFALYCIPCKKNVSCSHMGLAVVKQHCKGKTHLKMGNAVKECHKIAFPSSSTSTVIDAQIHVEVLHTNFIVQHNILFLTVDHLASLYKQMFLDSKSFPYSQTKTTSVPNKAIALLLHSALVDQMAENPFSIVNDGSSNCGLSKMNSVCVCIFDVQQIKVVEMKFFSMCSMQGRTVQNQKHCLTQSTTL